MTKFVWDNRDVPKAKKAAARKAKAKTPKVGRPSLAELRNGHEPTELMALRIPADDRKTVRAAAAKAGEKETVYVRRVLVERAKADLRKA